MINDRKLYFNHQADKSDKNKYSSQIELYLENEENLPKYLIDNKNKYFQWFDNK